MGCKWEKSFDSLRSVAFDLLFFLSPFAFSLKPRSSRKRRDNMAIAGDTPTIGSAPVPKHKEWNYSVGARVSRREEEEFRSFELNLNLSFLLSSLPPTPSFVSARR